MQNRRNIIKLCFDREHFAMKLHYMNLARQNKKHRAEAKLYDEPIDVEAKEMLLNEYFTNVCRKFCRYQQIVYEMARKYEQIYPLRLSVEDTQLLRREQRRLKHYF
jgi:hypothetical protein